MSNKGNRLTKVLADSDSVDGRNSIWVKGEGRPKRWATAKSPQNPELTMRREKLAQQKSYEAEANVEVEHWEKRNSDSALHEINQEFESQRFQLHQASRWADQAQRDEIRFYVELELKNRLFQESQAKDFQEVEELRRICYEETDRARQARIDELSCIKRGILRL